MGKRRLKQCKACRRKFTPKNQPVLETQAKEAAPTNQNSKAEVENNEAPVAGEIHIESNEATKPATVSEPGESDKPDEPVEEPEPPEMVPPPDEEWTL